MDSVEEPSPEGLKPAPRLQRRTTCLIPVSRNWGVKIPEVPGNRRPESRRSSGRSNSGLKHSHLLEYHLAGRTGDISVHLPGLLGNEDQGLVAQHGARKCRDVPTTESVSSAPRVVVEIGLVQASVEPLGGQEGSIERQRGWG